jgi:hypothetical protein
MSAIFEMKRPYVYDAPSKPAATFFVGDVTRRARSEPMPQSIESTSECHAPQHTLQIIAGLAPGRRARNFSICHPEPGRAVCEWW